MSRPVLLLRMKKNEFGKVPALALPYCKEAANVPAAS